MAYFNSTIPLNGPVDPPVRKLDIWKLMKIAEVSYLPIYTQSLYNIYLYDEANNFHQASRILLGHH